MRTNVLITYPNNLTHELFEAFDKFQTTVVKWWVPSCVFPVSGEVWHVAVQDGPIANPAKEKSVLDGLKQILKEHNSLDDYFSIQVLLPELDNWELEYAGKLREKAQSLLGQKILFETDYRKTNNLWEITVYQNQIDRRPDIEKKLAKELYEIIFKQDEVPIKQFSAITKLIEVTILSL